MSQSVKKYYFLELLEIKAQSVSEFRWTEKMVSMTMILAQSCWVTQVLNLCEETAFQNYQSNLILEKKNMKLYHKSKKSEKKI